MNIDTSPHSEFLTSPTTFTIMEQDPPQSELRFTSDFTFRSVDPRPNPWRRFWYWALLGWKWEAL